MNSLNDQLAAVTADFVKAAPQEILEVFARAADALVNLAPEGLQIGAKAPDFVLLNPSGNEVRLYEELKKGPVILVFYRGAWCPYCNLTLAAYQHALGDIHATGAQLVAVSPQTPDASLTMQEKHDLQFHVLSDKGNVTADAYKLTFSLQKELIDVHRKLGIELSLFNGDEAWRLPVPATFVVSQERVVTYAYVNTDHTHRTDPRDVLEHLKSK
ncbi:alkyl hydroperoxide reductase/ Thiol specific antioxidant/ Mal allergen [Paenibacillus curdlanolyticus YK9]|uniref:thioredoxin-dependent peroxiredoxin n=1 Tax=Paenibacillus curdlanolyticus YK9 TaxID=717606 RepID=E0I5R3_9BACL|nr:peroxiredoxin-like family protein [Paenibacillus curdlanolyticus]EFM12305.1 alkyl hydroperoxide reductase/ Thiol specific antioxidant/ Mal allergen [Paenibacillus curdlanolyticus YK9]